MKDRIKKMFTSGLVIYLFQLVLILAIFDLAIIPGINEQNSLINALSVVSALVLMVYAGYVFDSLLNSTIDKFNEGDEVKNEEKDSNI
jgi:hypothetical protein